MTIKLDDRVMVETLPDARGFRQAILGRVIYLDRTLPIGVMRMFVCYAYHPEAPEQGRYLPCSKTEYCFDLSEAKPEPEGMLRDLVVARAA